MQKGNLLLTKFKLSSQVFLLTEMIVLRSGRLRVGGGFRPFTLEKMIPS